MTTSGLTRRRLLQISAAVPLTAGHARAAQAETARWEGTALGAQATVLIAGLSAEEAAPALTAIQAEIDRLENIFSLYRPHSALSKLNRSGRLATPAPELLEVLSLSRSVWFASSGAFDPSVQPLWRARAEGAGSEQAPVGFEAVQFDPGAVTLARPGMALTLNGIAQGYITDRVAAVMRGLGLRDLVVSAGETRALGHRADGTPWRAGITDTRGQLVSRLSLRDVGLATSSPLGTVLPDGEGHIIDPRSGAAARRWQTVSVLHDQAAVADALSTAACCLSETATAEMLRQFDGARLAYRA